MVDSADKVDWYQTDSKVIITYLRKNLTPDDVRVDFDNRSVSVYFISKFNDGPIKRFELAHPVVPDKSLFRVTSMKIEITLMKTECLRWDTLEAVSDKINPNKVVHSYPTSCKSVHDWDKIEKEAAQMEDDEDPLNKLFKNIYSTANDDTRKAMIKSFTESGGTVLSTNWNEVGSGKVEMKPPDGMEFKNYEI